MTGETLEWEAKALKATLICCKRSLNVLKAVLQAWLEREKLEARGVKPISKVILLADKNMMVEEAVKELLKEFSIDFKVVKNGGTVIEVGERGNVFTIEITDKEGGDGLIVKVDSPSVAERMEAIRVLASGLGDFDLKMVAEACEGFSTLDIIRLVQFAASRSLADGREKVENDDFMEGVRVLWRRVRDEVKFPDELSEQLYLMAVSEAGEAFSELVHRLNAGERLDRKFEKMLARYSFILLDEPKERVIKLARARASFERLRRTFEGGQGS